MEWWRLAASAKHRALASHGTADPREARETPKFLDWLFVFPLRMEIMGAALATGISQTVSWLFVLTHFILKKGDLRVRPFKMEAALYRKVLFRWRKALARSGKGQLVLTPCY